MEQGRIEQERLRFEESERRQRLLSDVSRLLLDYVGPDEIEPLRRIVRGVAEAVGNDWCTFALVQPDGILKNVSDFWGALETDIKTLVGDAPGHSVVINRQSGVIVVRAMPPELRDVEDYLTKTESTVTVSASFL